MLIAYFFGNKIDGKIYWLNEFNPKLKKCLLIRANFSFFGMSFWLLAVYNLRIATCQIISTLNPVILIILGVIFLNEKYYTRYAWGVILGIVGSCIIILNENKISSSNNTSSSTSGFIIGILSMLANICITSIVWLVNKIMANERISLYTQLFYFGFFHFFYGLLWMLFTFDFNYPILYYLMCGSQAVLFFLGNYYNYSGLKLIDLNKTSIVQYSSIVFVLILGAIIVGEKIFFSDIIGSSLIVSFMIYHMINPIK